jgi:recombination protein RecR
MSQHPAILELLRVLSKLPGLGPRSAKRVLLHLMKKRDAVMTPLTRLLETVQQTIVTCDLCGNLDVASPCHICQDSRRDPSVLCVVEDVDDLWALETLHQYNGQFHCLGGVLSAMLAIGPDQLRIRQLDHRLKQGVIQEVILALGATIDGQTTTYYLADHLKGFSVKVTGLAHGVPVGGELDYLDEGTIATALQARRVLG